MCQTANADKDVAAMTGHIEHDTHNLNRNAIIATLHEHRPNAQLVYATFENKIGSRVPYVSLLLLVITRICFLYPKDHKQNTNTVNTGTQFLWIGNHVGSFFPLEVHFRYLIVSRISSQ